MPPETQSDRPISGWFPGRCEGVGSGAQVFAHRMEFGLRVPGLRAEFGWLWVLEIACTVAFWTLPMVSLSLKMFG